MRVGLPAVGSAPLLPDEARVVDRARRGDKAAFAQIYRAYARPLYARVLAPFLGDRDDAEDALRETFIAFHRALPSYAWKPPGLWPYLATLARNKARDLLRASGRRQRLRGAYAELLDALPAARSVPEAPDDAVFRGQLRAHIEQVLESMNPRYATVLRMRLLEGRGRPECAESLGVTLGNLDVLFFRAVRAFRKAWNTLHGEEAKAP